MAQKKPALITQLKTAKAEIESLQAQLTEANKKLASETSSKDHHYRENKKLDDELDQLHGLLDSIPGALPRKNEQSYTSYSAMTRLASWLMASRA